MLKIIVYPDKRLNQPCDKVEAINDELAELSQQMDQAMVAQEGAGLAAPQIGTNIRLFIVADPKNKEKFDVYINPTITYFSKKKAATEEGCLSIPGVTGFVERSAKIRLNYQDLKGQKLSKKAKGFEAIVIQHEVDHLNGILIIDKDIQVVQGQELIDSWRHAKTR